MWGCDILEEHCNTSRTVGTRTFYIDEKSHILVVFDCAVSLVVSYWLYINVDRTWSYVLSFQTSQLTKNSVVVSELKWVGSDGLFIVGTSVGVIMLPMKFEKSSFVMCLLSVCSIPVFHTYGCRHSSFLWAEIEFPKTSDHSPSYEGSHRRFKILRDLLYSAHSIVLPVRERLDRWQVRYSLYYGPYGGEKNPVQKTKNSKFWLVLIARYHQLNHIDEF